MKLKGLAIVIPALNEAKTIVDVVNAARETADTVILVDDGSTDGTGAAAKSAGAVVVRHETPAGYDGAIAAGLNRAFELGALAAVTCDADGQHRLEDVRRVAEPVLKGEVDLCAGVRDHYNRPIEGVVGFFSRFLLGTKDPFCGLKCYSRRFYETCGRFPSRLNIGTLPMVWMKKKNLPHSFIPILSQKRADQPRFGRCLKANIKLAWAFARTSASFCR